MFFVYPENFKISKFWEKKKNFSVSAHICYDHGEDIKSHFMTLGKSKTHNASQNNINHSWNEGQKWLKTVFFFIFS